MRSKAVSTTAASVIAGAGRPDDGSPADEVRSEPETEHAQDSHRPAHSASAAGSEDDAASPEHAAQSPRRGAGVGERTLVRPPRTDSPRPEWKAEVTERRWNLRVLRVTLAHETHYLKVRIGTRDSIELDGVLIWKESFFATSPSLAGPHSLKLTDGAPTRSGTLKVRTAIALAITGVELEVDGRTLIE